MGCSLCLNTAINRQPSGNILKALEGMGFTGEIQKVATKSGRPPETVSLRDFNRLLAYAVSDGKKTALALQLALTEASLVDFFKDSFNEAPQTIGDKRKLFYEVYAAALTSADWRQMDRDDIKELHGDRG